MPPLPRLRDIRAKKQELADKIAGTESALEKLRLELRDYEAAERVWLELSGGSDDDRDELDKLLEDVEEQAKRPKRKPHGIPQMPDMIIEAIEAGTKMGAPGIDPAAMLQYIQGRYWPDATSPDVSSTAWRMWKMGRLEKPFKDSPIYALPGRQKVELDRLIGGQVKESGVV